MAVVHGLTTRKWRYFRHKYLNQSISDVNTSQVGFRMIYFLRESTSVSMGGWLSIPTCIAQFHSVYTRAACSFRLVKMNNKCDVGAEARGRGGVWVGR